MRSSRRTENRPDDTAAWTRVDTAAIVLLTAAGAVLRLVRLTTPTDTVFDEAYYVYDGCSYFDASPACPGAETSPVHPPLGKWLVGLGIRIFGYSPGGWRIAAVSAGILTIPLLYLLARKTLRSSLGAIAAAGLLAIDFLHFVHSRIAMLDVFVTFFGVAAFLFALYDRDASARERPPWMRRLIGTPWRLAAGIAAGAAATTKWAGFFILAGVVALTVLSELTKRRADGGGRALARTIRDETVPTVLTLGVVPVVVYLVSYIGVVDGAFLAWPWRDGSWLHAVWTRQRGMAAFHRSIADLAVPSNSGAWSWPLVKRPVAYFFETNDGQYREILGFGSPLVWWASVAAVAVAAVGWVRAQRLWCAEAVIVVAVLSTWAPWILIDLAGRSFMFLFYFLPAVPFMLLALGYAATKVVRFRGGRSGLALAAAACVAAFVFFYPLLVGTSLSGRDWHARILFEEGCGALRPAPGEVPDLRLMRRGPPSPGWCWI